MNSLQYVIPFYLIMVNIWAYTLMAKDKTMAKRHGPRLPEKRLFLFAFIGGSLGIYVGMKYFHHKTKHVKFFVGIPLIMITEGIVLILICIYTFKNAGFLW